MAMTTNNQNYLWKNIMCFFFGLSSFYFLKIKLNTCKIEIDGKELIYIPKKKKWFFNFPKVIIEIVYGMEKKREKKIPRSIFFWRKTNEYSITVIRVPIT